MRFFEKRSTVAQTRPFVRVKIMEFDDISREEVAEFHAKWAGVADMVQVTGIHNWSGEIDGVRVTDESSRVRYPCAIMWYALVVNWNGEVTVCSVDWNTQIRVGNVKERTLHAIWNSPEIKEARRSQVDGRFDKYSVCRDCVVWVSVGNMGDWFSENKQFISEEVGP
jgi:radical SAM protein with 4Fe4S-binding SPASM domain